MLRRVIVNFVLQIYEVLRVVDRKLLVVGVVPNNRLQQQRAGDAMSVGSLLGGLRDSIKRLTSLIRPFHVSKLSS